MNSTCSGCISCGARCRSQLLSSSSHSNALLRGRVCTQDSPLVWYVLHPLGGDPQYVSSSFIPSFCPFRVPFLFVLSNSTPALRVVSGMGSVIEVAGSLGMVGDYRTSFPLGYPTYGMRCRTPRAALHGLQTWHVTDPPRATLHGGLPRKAQEVVQPGDHCGACFP